MKPLSEQDHDTGLKILIYDYGDEESPEIRAGQFAYVNYQGYLEDGTVFDQNNATAPEDAFKFQVGAGRVIPGWDQGILGMKAGGRRTLIIPPELGYGERGAPPKIPGNSVLIFDIQLRGIVE